MVSRLWLLGAVGLDAMNVSSCFCRCSWPELWAGPGSQLYGIAHHISMCDMDTYGARVMGFMRLYFEPLKLYALVCVAQSVL